MSDYAYTVTPLRGMRAMIADNMQKSLQESAQLTHHGSCDVTGLMAMKERLLNDEEIKVSVEDLMMSKVIETIKCFPSINARVIDREIQVFEDINLSIAIALPGDLLVAPAIIGAGDMTVSELRSARQDLSTRAKSNKVSMKEFKDGTFTISNLGLTRVEHFTPILNVPQIAILGIGMIQPYMAKTEDGGMEWRSKMGLSLTFDHRAIDGAPAANFLTELCKNIESSS